MPEIPSLKTLTIEQIAAGLDNKEFTVTQLIQAHLDQINRFDGELHAVLQLNPRSLAIAGELDAEFGRSGRRSLLHGVPILVKDNIVTLEQMEATAGSLALLGAKPKRESLLVTKLRAAGCVILGTTNCSEWANFRSIPSDSGWSARGGQTYAAYHFRQDPGGSSSGSGVAVDMGFCVIAIGTETSGSIISPSTQSNIVGLKPTTGLVSRDSIIPISPEQDTPGPMARTVIDAAIALQVIAGRDKHDPKTANIPYDTIPDYHQACLGYLPEPPGTLRLGIPRNAFVDMEEEMRQEFEDSVVTPLRERGVTIVDRSFSGMERFEGMTPVEKSAYMAGEFHDALLEYFSSLTENPQHIDSLEALCDFTKNTDAEEYGEEDELNDSEGNSTGQLESSADSVPRPSVGLLAGDSPRPSSDGPRPRRNIARLEQATRLTRSSPEYLAGREASKFFAGAGGIQGALNGLDESNDKDIVDALLLPTFAWAANYFAGCEGHPQITIPLGYRTADTEIVQNETGRLTVIGPNVPYGVSVIGRKFDEAALLRICAVIEEITQARKEAESKRLPHLRG